MKSRQIFLMFSTILILALVLTGCGGRTPDTTTGDQGGDQGTGGVLPTAESQPQGGGRAPEFFTEEFDGDLSNWTYEFAMGNEADAQIFVENGRAIYQYNAENTQTFTLYDPYEYGDVKVEITVLNRGVNNHFISLVCRWTDDGHYEAYINGAGLYWIYGYGGGGGSELKSGGSNDIKAGKTTNVYTLICEGQTLTLLANGKEVARINDASFGLTEGQVGFGVASQTSLPLDVAIESYTISEP